MSGPRRGLYTAGAVGVAAVATLYGTAISRTPDPRSHGWFWLGVAVIGVLILCGLVAASNQVFNWPPLDWLAYEHRQKVAEAKRTRERQMLTGVNRALKAVDGEMVQSLGWVQYEIRFREHMGFGHSQARFDRSRDLVSRNVSESTLQLVEAAYRQTERLNTSRREREKGVTSERFHDREWKALSDGELSARIAAAKALGEAILAIRDAMKPLP
jgi:hypothetical protein